MSFKSKFKQYATLVEQWLLENIRTDEIYEKKAYEAMNYSLLAGGKRLRPVLSLAVCDLLNGSRSIVLPYACSLELIHTYSLIHDDLPCMDNDDLRRGMPTNHKIFGDAMAVLAGDGLLNLAFEIMLTESSKAHDNLGARLNTALLIAKASGVSGMIGGQVIDMESEGKSLTFDELTIMHQKKTGALINAAVLIPAVLFDCDKRFIDTLSAYANHIGLAFQIKDDILDYEGNTDIVGKTRSDEKNNKSTFVTVMGMERAKELLKNSIERAVEYAKSLENSDFLIQMAAYIAERDR